MLNLGLKFTFVTRRASLDSFVSLVSWCDCLQPGEVALTVPKSLVVTLEKVLGDETIGMVNFD